MEQEQRAEIPAELAKVHLLVWFQSAMGPIVVGAGLFVGALHSQGPLIFGALLCVIAWMLAFAPLQGKARSIPPEARAPAPDAPRWLVRAAGFGQLVCSVSMFWNPWGALILPANIFVGLVVFLRIMACHGMDLPTERSRWGNLLLILLFGTLWNAVAAAAAFSFTMRC